MLLCVFLNFLFYLESEIVFFILIQKIHKYNSKKKLNNILEPRTMVLNRYFVVALYLYKNVRFSFLLLSHGGNVT